MKTKSTVGRLITHLSEWRESSARVAGTDTAQETRKRRATYAARVAAMLLLLCTTAIPAWAYRYSWSEEYNENSYDGDGGKYRCSGETDDVDVSLHHKYYVGLTTHESINPAEDKFCWTATIGVGCCDIEGGS